MVWLRNLISNQCAVSLQLFKLRQKFSFLKGNRSTLEEFPVYAGSLEESLIMELIINSISKGSVCGFFIVKTELQTFSLWHLKSCSVLYHISFNPHNNFIACNAFIISILKSIRWLLIVILNAENTTNILKCQGFNIVLHPFYICKKLCHKNLRPKYQSYSDSLIL